MVPLEHSHLNPIACSFIIIINLEHLFPRFSSHPLEAALLLSTPSLVLCTTWSLVSFLSFNGITAICRILAHLPGEAQTDFGGQAPYIRQDLTRSN